MPTRYRMSPGDAAWLHMDRPTNRMIVNSLLWLDGAPPAQEIVDVIAHRLVGRYPRFAQRVVDRVTAVWWEDVEPFDIRDHIRVLDLPAPGSPEQLRECVSGLASRSLDRRRPLWETYLIYGYEGDRCVVMTRLHHCIADGVALSRVLLGLADETAAEPFVVDRPAARSPGRPDPFTRIARTLWRTGGALLSPGPTLAVARSTLALFGRRADPRTALHRTPGTHKQLAWSEPLPLEPLLAAARRRHGTLNELFLAAITGALRTHLAREDGAGRDVRAIVPVNLRPPTDRTGLGNAFGLVYVALPAATDDPEARFAEVRRRVAATKRSPDAFVSLRLLDLTGHLPYEEEQLLVGPLARKGSLVVTNVPGPPRNLHLAGATITHMTGYPPESGGLGLGMSLISYGGGIVIGAMADSDVVADADRLVADTVAELARLQQRPRVAGPVARPGTLR